MTQAKTSPFYQLTHNEWLETVKELTGAEIKVLYYIRSLDPFGNCKHEYSVTQMAEDLGLSKGAVSKALKKLEQVGEIDIELVRVKIQIRPSKNEVEELFSGNVVSYEKNEFPIGNDDLPEETSVSSSEQQLPIGNSQPLESLQDKDFSPSNTIKTYSDFINTLSENERENFLNYCRNKIKNFRQEVNDLEAWLAHKNKAGQNRWEVYYQSFLENGEKQSNKHKYAEAFQQWQEELRTKERLAEETSQ